MWCLRKGTSSFPRGISHTSACTREKREAASVFGRIGTHSAEAAPVTDRCGFHRRLLPVFDVGALVGERACRLSPLEARLVEIGKGEGELVLAAESTAGTVVLDGRIARVGGQAGLVAAVGPGGEVVIDCDELLADPRFGAGAAPRSVT